MSQRIRQDQVVKVLTSSDNVVRVGEGNLRHPEALLANARHEAISRQSRQRLAKGAEANEVLRLKRF